MDLLFFALRCLVIIDLKLGEFTHADVGQMHLCLNYAREHGATAPNWTRDGLDSLPNTIHTAQLARTHHLLKSQAGDPS